MLIHRIAAALSRIPEAAGGRHKFAHVRVRKLKNGKNVFEATDARSLIVVQADDELPLDDGSKDKWPDSQAVFPKRRKPDLWINPVRLRDALTAMIEATRIDHSEQPLRMAIQIGDPTIPDPIRMDIVDPEDPSKGIAAAAIMSLASDRMDTIEKDVYE